MRFIFPHSPAAERTQGVMQANSDIFYLFLDEYADPSADKEATICDYLTQMVAGGNEICTDMRHNWMYPSYTAVLTMAKVNKTIWNKLSEDVQNKIDLLARCLLVSSAVVIADQNQSVNTGLGLTGNVGRNWNANIRTGLVAPVGFLYWFFGDGNFGGYVEVNRILADFDYDTYLAEIRAAGFTNIEAIWTTPGFYDGDGDYYPGAADILSFESDGESYLELKVKDRFGNISGAGKYYGVKQDLYYNGLDSTNALLKAMLWNTYRGNRVCKSSVEVDGITCSILDGTTSPVEDELGTICEFLPEVTLHRSSLFHSTIDFIMCTEIIAAGRAMGLWSPCDITCDEAFTMIDAGNIDLLYKLDHGYHDYDYMNEDDMTAARMLIWFPQLTQARSMWENTLHPLFVAGRKQIEDEQLMLPTANDFADEPQDEEDDEEEEIEE